MHSQYHHPLRQRLEHLCSLFECVQNIRFVSCILLLHLVIGGFSYILCQSSFHYLLMMFLQCSSFYFQVFVPPNHTVTNHVLFEVSLSGQFPVLSFSLFLSQIKVLGFFLNHVNSFIMPCPYVAIEPRRQLFFCKLCSTFPPATSSWSFCTLHQIRISLLN